MSAMFFGVDRPGRVEKLSGLPRRLTVSEAELRRVNAPRPPQRYPLIVNPETWRRFVRAGVIDKYGRFL